MAVLTNRQQKAYEQFYEPTHDNEFLDEKTELLAGFPAAMALDCAALQQLLSRVRKKCGYQERKNLRGTG